MMRMPLAETKGMLFFNLRSKCTTAGSKADALFADIDYTGNHHFPYLFNMVCFNSITKCYMTCGRSLMNHQDGISIGKALKVLFSNVKHLHPRYELKVCTQRDTVSRTLMKQNQMGLKSRLVKR